MTAPVHAETVNPEVTKQIAQSLREIPSPYREFDASIVAAHRAFYRHLPDELAQKISTFGYLPDAPGVMFLEGLPIDLDLPATPQGHAVPDRSSFVSEGSLLGLSRFLGEPVGFLSEKAGQLIHNVTPVAEGAYTQSNQGSKVFLNYHNDTVYEEGGNYHRYNPDFLVLLCLRADHEGLAKTYYVDARHLIRAMTPAEVALLRQPLFRMAAPSSYTRERAGGQRVWSPPYPVLSGTDATPEISVTANGIEGINDEAQRVVERMLSVFQDPAVHSAVALRPGNALLINNRKGLHARGVFEPAYDGNDRWLMRTYVRRNLWDMRHMSAGRPRVYT